MERHASAIRARMNELQQRCREAGMNVTPQRMAVYKALLQSEEHPTPEVLYKRVRRSMPSLSLATIYKTLDALEQLGLVQEVSIGSDSRRYDANMATHHHLVCTSCGKITDFYDASLDGLRPSWRLSGFSAASVSVRILGSCDGCARDEKR